jgi:hypothetical protein
MNEKPFEFTVLPQAPGALVPSEQPVKRKRGRRRGVTAIKTTRARAKVVEHQVQAPVRDMTQLDNEVRKAAILDAVKALQYLDAADAKFVAGLFT